MQLFTALGKAPDASKFANVARFYNHIASFSADARGKFPSAFGGKAAAPAAKPAAVAAPAPAAEEEDIDLFGDDADAAAAKVAASTVKVGVRVG